MADPSSPAKVLDLSQPQQVTYAIPLWLRDEQIKINIAQVRDRIQPHELRDDPIAVVCYGPSLNDTWEEIRNFKYIITCSGAHRFLLDRGIVPTWHVDVDPRLHKLAILGEPDKRVLYLPAATCHPDYVRSLVDWRGGPNGKCQLTIRLWHIFDNKEDALRTLPHGEWALFGGADAGLRAMVVARFFGFTNQHIFGMDHCEGASGKHAAAHPNQPRGHALVHLNGKEFRTTPAMAECARQIPHELGQLPDVRATFYGDGLAQEIARTQTPERIASGTPSVGIEKPKLISDDYRRLNAELHRSNLAYGVGGGKHAPMVRNLAADLKTRSILDYGCGKGYLAKELDFPIWEYDPCIEGKSESPRPADLVICTDVLEHIEPDHLLFVLGDLRRVVRKVGYFVIDTHPATKSLPDGRNTHLLQCDREWWKKKLKKFFHVAYCQQRGHLLHCLVGPKTDGDSRHDLRSQDSRPVTVKSKEAPSV